MENDISMFKKSLEIMQSLNEKYKLYTKVSFIPLRLVNILLPD